MKYNETEQEQIINFGAFGYPAAKIANILGLDPLDVLRDMDNTESDLCMLMQKGRDMADYVIDLKLFEMAKSGDIKALDKLQQRKAVSAKMDSIANKKK